MFCLQHYVCSWFETIKVAPIICFAFFFPLLKRIVELPKINLINVEIHKLQILRFMVNFLSGLV